MMESKQPRPIRNRGVRTVAALFAVVTPQVVHAQDMAEYWARLEEASTIAAVEAVRLPIVPHGSASEAAADGLRQIRLYELTFETTVAREARRLLERTVARSDADAWAHFALGVVLARGPDVRVRPPADRSAWFVDPNSNAAARAPRALRRALELDPEFDAAAFALASLALDLADRALMTEATRALDRPRLSDNPRSLLVRSVLMDRLGRPDRAASLAGMATASGADRSLAAHAAASARFRIRGEEMRAAELWFAGLDSLSPAAETAYYQAVRAIMTESEIVRWRRAAAPERRDMLRRFWDLRAALAGVTVAERMAAHYQRLAVVRTPSRHRSMMGAVAAGDGLGPDVRALGVTDAGALSLLRHGDPDRMNRLLYCGQDIDTLPPALQPTVEQCVATANGRYQAILMRDSGSKRLLLAGARKAAITGDSYYPPYLTHLALAWQVWRFRAAGEGTAIVAALSLPRSAMDALSDSDGRIVAEMTLTLADTSDGWIRREQTAVRVATPGSVPADDRTLLHTRTVALPGRTVALRLGIESVDRTAGRIVAGDIDTIDFAADTLAVSDIVIAPLDGRRSFRRGDTELTLAPHRLFAAGEPFDLFYEIYGVGEDEILETEILVTPIREGVLDHIGSVLDPDEDHIRLTFRETAPGPHPVFGLQVNRIVTPAGLSGGDYRVRITITNTVTGRSVHRESILRVGEPAGPG